MIPWRVVIAASLVGCGGPSPPAASGNSHDVQCKLVVDRYDAIDRDLKKIEDPKTDDLAVMATVFRQAAGTLAQASADFAGMKLDDAPLAFCAKDVATYMRSLQSDTNGAADILQRLATAKARVDGIDTRSDAAAVGGYCKANQTPECEVVMAWIVNFPNDAGPARDEYIKRGRALHLRDSTLETHFRKVRIDFEEIDRNVQVAQSASQEYQAWGKRLADDKRGDELDERLHTLCGRPIPPK